MRAPGDVNTAEVARLLGVSRASVSRFRSGSRIPRIATRQKIAALCSWPVEAQATAEAAGTWAEEFKRKLSRTPSLG